MQMMRLLVDHAGELPILVVGIAAHGVLQRRDSGGVPHVFLAAHTERIFAADVQHRTINRRIAERIAVAPHRFFGDLRKAHALDARRSAGEVFCDEIRFQPHRIEDLRAAIGLIGGMPIFDITFSSPLSIDLM